MSRLSPGNDNLLLVLGVLDELDPENTDGTPKYVNDMAVTWQARDAAVLSSGQPGGVLVASGSGALITTGPLKNAGNYKCELDHDIAFLAAQGYFYYVVGTQPVTGFKFTLADSFESLMRTGQRATI